MHCSVQSNRAFRHFMLLRSLLIVVAFVNGARMVHIIYTNIRIDDYRRKQLATVRALRCFFQRSINSQSDPTYQGIGSVHQVRLVNRTFV
jgi:hypothetical protein